MRKLFKTMLLAAAAATLGACGGGGGSPGDTNLEYTISLKADTTVLPINLANETPGIGNYSGIGAYARYTTVLHVQAMEGKKPILDGKEIFACNLSGGLKSGALYYLDGKDEHMVEIDDGMGGKIKIPGAYRSIVLDSNAGGASFHFHAGDEAGPVQIRCAVTNPTDKQVSSAIVNLTVGANTGKPASVVGTIQAPRYLGSQSNKQSLPTSVGVSVDVKDDANQPIPNPANANVQVRILPFGASAGARLLSGSQQGSVVQVKTINGIGQFAVSSGPSAGVILLELTTDRADNDVTNGIQDAVRQLRVVTVHNAVASVPLTIKDTELSVTNGMPYNFALTAEGGVPPYVWSSSALPGGLSLSADGIVSGTPAVKDGTYDVTLTVVDETGNPVSKNIKVKVSGAFAIDGCTSDTATPCSLPAGKVGSVYSYTLSLSIGDLSVPVVWAVTGNLPSGLTLAADGTISGTPTAAGTYVFIVKATRGSIVISRQVQIVVS